MPETTRKTNATKAVLDTPRNSQKKAALPFEIFLDIAELAVAEIADKTDTEYWDLEWDDDTASNVLLCYGFNGPEPDQHDFHQRWRYRKISTFMQINHMTRSTVTKAALVIFPLQKRRKKDIGKAFIFPKRDKFNLIAYHWSIFGSSPRPTIWNAMECPNNAFKPLWNRLSCVVVDSPYFFQQTNGKKANILLALPGLAAVEVDAGTVLHELAGNRKWPEDEDHLLQLLQVTFPDLAKSVFAGKHERNGEFHRMWKPFGERGIVLAVSSIWTRQPHVCVHTLNHGIKYRCLNSPRFYVNPCWDDGHPFWTS